MSVYIYIHRLSLMFPSRRATVSMPCESTTWVVGRRGRKMLVFLNFITDLLGLSSKFRSLLSSLKQKFSSVHCTFPIISRANINKMRWCSNIIFSCFQLLCEHFLNTVSQKTHFTFKGFFQKSSVSGPSMRCIHGMCHLWNKQTNRQTQ